MTKLITLIAMMLVFMLPALTTPAFAASHAKAEAATADAPADKKKKKGEEEEEPECE